MNDLLFNVLFDCIAVISGRRADDNERLCAIEPHLRFIFEVWEWILSEQGKIYGTKIFSFRFRFFLFSQIPL